MVFAQPVFSQSGDDTSIDISKIPTKRHGVKKGESFFLPFFIWGLWELFRYPAPIQEQSWASSMTAETPFFFLIFDQAT